MLQNFKISFYINSHVDKLFGSQESKKGRLVVNVGVIVWRDDVRGTMVKENDGGGWSFDVVVL
jgi:hypothetical protein